MFPQSLEVLAEEMRLHSARSTPLLGKSADSPQREANVLTRHTVPTRMLRPAPLREARRRKSG